MGTLAGVIIIIIIIVLSLTHRRNFYAERGTPTYCSVLGSVLHPEVPHDLIAEIYQGIAVLGHNNIIPNRDEKCDRLFLLGFTWKAYTSQNLHILLRFHTASLSKSPPLLNMICR